MQDPINRTPFVLEVSAAYPIAFVSVSPNSAPIASDQRTPAVEVRNRRTSAAIAGGARDRGRLDRQE
ncbi:hypothetical protein MUK42_28376 [Musa troglodytarum]|uniref:Uncharacterized protein n=1 Tax=Musa troglodytarum TaxID=320322 RepID=A0A9E7F509_9LILI|nr:hypothetical protein MUK42_28376 [Musa troglodytarum]